MKRAIALLLALVMVFALCGCGSKGLTPEEREKIFYEVAEEKGIDVSKQTGADTYYKAQDASGSAVDSQSNDKDLISVEEFSINPDRGWRTLKIRNLSGRTIPNFIVDYVFLDKNGDILDTSGHIVTERIMVEDGQAFTEEDQHVMADGDYSKVEKVKFTTYTLREVVNGNFLWVEEYPFIEEPVFVRNPDGSYSKTNY